MTVGATGKSEDSRSRAESSTMAPATRPFYVVLTGNPNSGKTTLFNALTGLRAKVGNYAGVTVERKEGRLLGAPAGMDVRVLDLPGTYSLSPNSLDEQISRDVLMHRLPELPPPSLIVVVVDASNLQRNLYYTTQVIELGHPTVIALNMVDVAENNGYRIDEKKLSGALGVPVMPIVASSGAGVPELRAKIIATLQDHTQIKPKLFCQLPGLFRIEATGLADLLAETFKERRLQATAEALLMLSNEKALASSKEHYPQKIQDAVAAARKRLEAHGIDWRGAPIEWRYARVAEIQQAATAEFAPPGETFSDKMDRVLTHKIWGTLIFIGLMTLMFQSIFTFAKIPMDALQTIVDWAGTLVGRLMPPGDLNDLLVDGVIAGVGAVIVFLPQILLLFLFIGFLEDTGYMARAAFLMDRLMSKVGLHGKSFIPMLSSYACAIPGIMATRTIETPEGPAGDDSGRAADELFGAAARLYAAHRGVHSGHQNARLPQTAGADDAGDVSARHGCGAADGLAVQKDAAQGRNPDAHHGTAALQTPAAARGGAAHVGPLEALPAPRGHGDSGREHPAVVPGDVSEN